jgi:CHAT domain-containing protein
MEREEEFEAIERQKRAYIEHLWSEHRITRSHNRKMEILRTIERTLQEIKNLNNIDAQCDNVEINNLTLALAMAEEKEAIRQAMGKK